MALLDGLNPAQRSAAQALDGPVLILAGAGSGKTRTLTHRAAHLLQQKRCHPSQLLVVTFTNKAAGELRERLAALVDDATAQQVWAMTFHALCVRILRRSANQIGLPNDFTIVDTADSRKLLKQAVENVKDPAREDADEQKRFRSIISRGKNAGAAPDSLTSSRDPFFVRAGRVWAEYDRLLREVGGMDFDDLLLKALAVLETRQGALTWAGRFRYVCVDEHQDTNRVQDRLVKALCGDHNNICVVGDESQSIYAFRGAEVRNILRFAEAWPGAQIFKLEENYRSQANIINAANAVIERSAERTDKRLVATKPAGAPVRLLTFDTHWDEARFIADRISTLIGNGASADSIAIAYRTNAQSQVLEEKLLERAIKYRVIGGVEFNRRVEVQAVRAYLSLLVNRKDRLAFERAIAWPKRGVGDATVKLIAEQARTTADRDIRAAASTIAATKPSGVNSRAVTGLTGFVTLLDRLQVAATTRTLGDIVREVIVRSGIEAMLREAGETGRDQLANLDQLVALAERWGVRPAKETLPEFLEATALNEGAPDEDDHEPAVTLMTLHATKGLEFPYVFLPGMEEELFLRPDSAAADVEESRRLLYVGMTRAEHELIMSLAEVRRMWGRETQMRPLRFLLDLPAEVVQQRARSRTSGRPASPPRDARRAARPSAFASETPAPRRRPVPADLRVRSSDFRVGQRVAHPKFGAGTVVAVDGEKIQVRFADGVRTLAIAFARLKAL